MGISWGALGLMESATGVAFETLAGLERARYFVNPNISFSDWATMSVDQQRNVTQALPRTPRQEAAVAANEDLLRTAALVVGGAVVTDIVSDIQARRDLEFQSDLADFTQEEINQFQYIGPGGALPAPPALPGEPSVTYGPTGVPTFNPASFQGAGQLAGVVPAIVSQPPAEQIRTTAEPEVGGVLGVLRDITAPLAPAVGPVLGGLGALGGGLLAFFGLTAGGVARGTAAVASEVTEGLFGLAGTTVEGFFGLGEAYLARPVAAAPAAGAAPAAAAGLPGLAGDPFLAMFGGQNLFLMR